MIPVHEALKAISERRGDAIVVSTMMAAREWPPFTTCEQLDLPLTGCMGKASSLGLGIALARPGRKVIVLDGDGSLLMNLGSLVTIANARPRNLVHCVFENGIYEVTGGQPVPGEGTFNFAMIARGAGFPNVYDLDDTASMADQLDEAFSKPGPTFITLRVTPVGNPGSRPKRKTAHAVREVKEALAAGG
jgi:thiamine pyrophosphate-dependent acetolactate synthase large subunit-like protein